MSPQADGGPGQEVAAPARKDVDLLAEEIMSARKRQLDAKISRGSKRDIMWFGGIHACDRNNFYQMTEGDQASRWNDYVQAKMDAGNEWEQITKRELSALGYEPIMAGEVCEIKGKHGTVIARGRTDLSLRRIGERHKTYPCEMKQMQPFVWEAINTVADLHRNQWTKKYVRQLMLYMYAKNIDQGLFHLGDFQGHWKLIPVYMDWDFCEDTIKKIETAIEAKAAGKAPERIAYDHALCGMCNFQHVCIPDITQDPRLKVVNNEALAAMLERRDALLDKWKEVEQISKKIKSFFENVKDGAFTVGNFVVTRKAQNRKKYEVPDEIKMKFVSSSTIYVNDIERFQQPDPEAMYLEPRRIISLEEAD